MVPILVKCLSVGEHVNVASAHIAEGLQFNHCAKGSSVHIGSIPLGGLTIIHLLHGIPEETHFGGEISEEGNDFLTDLYSVVRVVIVAVC